MKLDRLGDDLERELMGVINRQFYCDGPEKAFFWDHSLLIQAIRAPAVYLHDRGITREFSVDRYRALVMGIIAEIKRHGNTSKIAHFGRYFFKCVQDHMRHQGQRYYEECIATRNHAAEAANLAENLISKQKRPATDPTVEILATAAKLAAGRRIKKRASTAPVPQLDLFASTPPAATLRAPGRRPA